jgi:hypothetical protein
MTPEWKMDMLLERRQEVNWLMRLEKKIQQSAKESRKFVDADAVLGEEEY